MTALRISLFGSAAIAVLSIGLLLLQRAEAASGCPGSAELASLAPCSGAPGTALKVTMSDPNTKPLKLQFIYSGQGYSSTVDAVPGSDLSKWAVPKNVCPSQNHWTVNLSYLRGRNVAPGRTLYDGPFTASLGTFGIICQTQPSPVPTSTATPKPTATPPPPKPNANITPAPKPPSSPTQAATAVPTTAPTSAANADCGRNPVNTYVAILLPPCNNVSPGSAIVIRQLRKFGSHGEIPNQLRFRVHGVGNYAGVATVVRRLTPGTGVPADFSFTAPNLCSRGRSFVVGVYYVQGNNALAEGDAGVLNLKC